MPRPLVFLLTLICLVVLAPRPGSSQTAGGGRWTTRATLGEPRTEPGTAWLNGRLYVVGGMARGQDAHPLVQEYDPATDRWRERAPMPGPLSHPAAVPLNGKIYVFGGFLRNVHLDAQTSVFVYDPKTDAWQALAPLAVARGAVGAVAIDGKIHVIGGRGVDRVTVGTHELYDPATNRWTTLAPLPQPRDHIAVVAVGRRIHVIGGRLNTPVENVNTHDVYDVRTNSWTPAPPLPTPRSGGGGVLYKGQIVVFGGECDNGQPFRHNEAFNPRTGRWTTLAPMGAGRHGITAATDGRVIYVPAGAPNCATASSDTLQVFSW